MRPIIFTLFCLLLAGHVVAQSANTPPGQISPATGSAKGNGKITGYVLDSTLTKAVEFANVALYEISSGKLVDGAVADDKGKFSITRLAPGSYRLQFSFLGYNAKTVDNIVLGKGETKGLGVVRLSASTRT